MRIDSLEKALSQPRPFELLLADGRKLVIAHPEFVWLVPPHKSELVISHGKTRWNGTVAREPNRLDSMAQG